MPNPLSVLVTLMDRFISGVLFGAKYTRPVEETGLVVKV